MTCLLTLTVQKTAEAFAAENNNSSQTNNGASNSKLMTLLRVGRRRTAIRHKDVFSILSEVAMNLLDYNNDEGDPEVEQVDHLRVRSSTTNSKDRGEQDINIWEEVGENMTTGVIQSTTSSNDSSSSSNLNTTSDKKVILAASLNRLVQLLTNEKDKVSGLFPSFTSLILDILFMKTFLYTYQSFTTPDTLLKKLIERYHVPVPKGGADDKFKTEVQQPIRSRVCSGTHSHGCY